MISSARARRVATAAAATVMCLSAVATAAPASAESRTLKDGRGDTWDVSGDKPVKKSGHPEGDLRKVVIKYSARKVVITSRVQNLKKKGEAVGVSVSIDTPSDVSYSASAAGEKGAWKGRASFYASDGGTCEPSHKMNYRKDVVRLAIPKGCLGSPTWVRVQVLGIYVPNESKYFADSAHGAKLDAEFTRRITRG